MMGLCLLNYSKKCFDDTLRDTRQKQQTLTEASELADDVGQADVGDTFQLAADVGGDGLATQMPRLDVPCDQWHSVILTVGVPNPVGKGSCTFMLA